MFDAPKGILVQLPRRKMIHGDNCAWRLLLLRRGCVANVNLDSTRAGNGVQKSALKSEDRYVELFLQQHLEAAKRSSPHTYHVHPALLLAAERRIEERLKVEQQPNHKFIVTLLLMPAFARVC